MGSYTEKMQSRNYFRSVFPSKKGKKILKEIHDGTYGKHAASRTLVGKAFRAGFYWPSAIADAEDYVRRCENC
jgi:hypothetical protein